MLISLWVASDLLGATRFKASGTEMLAEYLHEEGQIKLTLNKQQDRDPYFITSELCH